MSRYSGPQSAYARRLVRAQKREEAEARNALTLPERRKNFRRLQSLGEKMRSYLSGEVTYDADAVTEAQKNGNGPDDGK